MHSVLLRDHLHGFQAADGVLQIRSVPAHVYRSHNADAGYRRPHRLLSHDHGLSFN